MSVLIKRMKMPKHRGYCRFRYDGICHALQRTQYSMDECPLIDEDVIKTQSSAQPDPHWIPCSERLPEEYGEYRITWTTSASKKRLVGDSEYEVTSEWDEEHCRFKGEWLLPDYIRNCPDVKVIAWMPLPEPYTEGE